MNVALWFDPICPWAWATSRWLLAVEQVREIHVEFHVMSLAVLNAGRTDVDRHYRALARMGWGPARVCIAAELAYGKGILRPLYTTMGTLIHEERAGLGARMLTEALARVGLPAGLADAARCVDHDEALRTSHHAGVAALGDQAGTPVIQLPGPRGRRVAFFGPVVTPVPRGPAAGRLWDGIALLAGTEGFVELKRPRAA